MPLGARSKALSVETLVLSAGQIVVTLTGGEADGRFADAATLQADDDVGCRPLPSSNKVDRYSRYRDASALVCQSSPSD